jgi:hypothetical protein
MNKLVIGTAILISLPIFSGAAKAADMDAPYDKAYSACSEKADSADGAYEEVFTNCMKEKGFTEHEDDGSSPYGSGIGTGPEEDPDVLSPSDKKSL